MYVHGGIAIIISVVAAIDTCSCAALLFLLFVGVSLYIFYLFFIFNCLLSFLCKLISLFLGHFRPLFYFRLFNTVDSKQICNIYKFLPMTGFEQRTSRIESDRSTN